MPLIKKFEEIMAWQEARKLVNAIYQVTRTGDLSKDFGMRDQLQRAAISVMNNIAEGFDCESNLEFARFLVIARRSAVEIQSMLYAAHDIGYIDEKILKELFSRTTTTKALINALKNSLNIPTKKPS